MKNAIIIGAGPGLSTGLAQKFGNEDFQIGLISRNPQKLESQVSDLSKQGIKAFYATADAYRSAQLDKAIDDLKSQMGSVHTLIYNAAALKMKNLMEETTEEIVEDFKISTANAFHTVKKLHPDLKTEKGVVLFTGGAFALQPSAQFGSLSLGKSALRNLAFQLNDSLKEDGIFVGTVTIDGYIQHESETHSPAILAEKFWQLHQERSQIEIQY
ncbi:SDR family NAD(P)-dependent oxidoreductase [Nonlabens sp. SY33080]|uniref:SDR family NAD(P)-dependent oxidoreductase n=1 Tax=Nonlabens sp. SY33080 TaxID=2719911 RepID=UPI001428BD74|nr:SDR family NAD(P)-dependent oxidoreductase [Nonlabens sp. SY33080]